MIKWLGFVLLVLYAMNSVANGVVLVYHHVSTKTPPSTSISPAQFREHLDYLAKHHTVIPLGDMLNKLQTGHTLPDRAVAITFDDGYQNILQNGHPLLQEYGFSYTIFISPGSIGKQANQLSWEQVKQMHQQGVTFANHSFEHGHLLTRLPGETKSTWLSRVMADIQQAQAVLEQQLGEVPKWLAYPYGEYNLALANCTA